MHRLVVPWGFHRVALKFFRKPSRKKMLILLVPLAGLEPARCFHHLILSQARLPIPPQGQGAGIIKHDPEKWNPVFGQDHAETRVGAVNALCSRPYRQGAAAALFPDHGKWLGAAEL